MTRTRPPRTPASASACFAARWCSGSLSMVVRTPSAGMPASSHSVDTPLPVPTSTTARAAEAATSIRRAAPVPGSTGEHPSSTPRPRARSVASSSTTKSSA